MTATPTRPRGVDPLNTMMGVRVLAMSPTGTVLEGETGPRFHDHRGLSGLASVGVLADTAVAGAFFAALPPGNRTVVSQLTAAVAAPLPAAGALTARASTEHLDLDAGTGLSTGRVTAADGTTAVSLLARSVVVTRAARNDDRSGPAPALVIPAPEPADPESVAGLDGRAVVRGIAAGTIPRGPLAGLIGLEVESVSDATISARFTPAPWMSNQIGSVQGGVLFAAADLTTGLTAQILTSAGKSYRLLDLKIDFVRSPATDGRPIRVESEIVRAGRRIALIETRLLGSGGELLARSGSSVQLW
ncbi:PaaI family thioesterase [Rhodococcus sp. NPDC127528]|uniref:PaaI family thioesterase n=1 Tax=unclassified Rhodococcus (in: high G+C Gram-positive bacteria) TaxID=192944 RepID=UPI0036340DCA